MPRSRTSSRWTNSALERNDDGTQVDITGTIRWQSCDDHTCHIPRTETLSLTVPVAAANIQKQLLDPDPTDP